MKKVKLFLVQLFVAANIAAILLLWASCAVTYLPPDWHPRLGLLALAFPLFLLADLLFVLFWLIFKAKRVWIPIVGILGCGSFVRDYVPVNWPTPAVDSTLTVVSYNTRGYGGKDAALDDGSNAVVNYLIATNADILCLQETSPRSTIKEQFEQAGYEYRNIKEFTLCSRLPILEADTLALPGSSGHCMKALLLEGADTILVINQHLESNQLSPDVRNAYIEAIEKHHSDSMRKGLQPVADLLTVALPKRGLQVDSVQRLIDSWLPRPIILCGDFNDTPVSYTHRVLTKNLRSAYRESGNGVGFTYHDKGFPVRIDHILFSPDRWRSFQTSVCDTITYSDHLPICTHLARKTP